MKTIRRLLLLFGIVLLAAGALWLFLSRRDVGLRPFQTR